MDLIKINAAEYGLEESKAQEISAMFKPMLDKMVELENEFNDIAAREINEGVCMEAKQLRLQYVKVRTGTAEIHKGLKANYLRGGRFVDGWKNAQLAASGEMEKKLNAIENHFENEQKEKIAKLQEERSEKVVRYIPSGVVPDTLGLMTNEVWENFYSGTKANYKAMKEAEKKADRQRIDREKADREKKKRIIAENEKLKVEAAEREYIAKIEAKQRVEKETERIRKEIEAKRVREEKQRKERAEYEAKLKKENDKRQRIENEASIERELLESKIREGKRIEAERLQAIENARQAELNKGDSEKVKDLINDLKTIKTEYVFESKKNEKMYTDVGILIDKVISHIEK